MADEANGLDDGEFTEEEMAILNGQSTDDGDQEQAAEGTEEGQEGAEGEAEGEEAEQVQAQQQPATEPEKQKTVPHQALHEERERRRALEQQYRESEQQRARLDERMNILLQWAQSQNEAANQKPPPDQNEDPLGYLQWQNQQLQQQIQQYDQRFQEYDQRYQTVEQQQHYQQRRQYIQQAYNTDAAQLAQEKPDFNDAANYAYQVRARQLQAFDLEPNQIASQIQQEFEQMVDGALQKGRRPAEVLYNWATASGYQPGASPQQQAQAADAAAAGAGQQQAPQGQQANQQAGQRLKNIAKGQATNKSLSGSGSGTDKPIDAATVANMDDEEFAEVMNRMTDKKFEKLLGY